MKNKDFLKDCMAEALFSLMDEKAYNKITINDITNKAGVSRITWFRKFSDKTDAVKHFLNNKWQEWLIENNITASNPPNYTDVNFTFKFFLKNKDVFTKIYGAGLKNILLDSLLYMVKNLNKITIPDIYVKNFFGFAFFGVLSCWIERDYKETLPELQEYVNKILSYMDKK